MELEQLRRRLKIGRLGGERSTWQPPKNKEDKIDKEKEEDLKDCLTCIYVRIAKAEQSMYKLFWAYMFKFNTNM